MIRFCPILKRLMPGSSGAAGPMARPVSGIIRLRCVAGQKDFLYFPGLLRLNRTISY